VPGTFRSVFSEPDDFQGTASEEGVVRFLVTAPGQFRARMTQIVLHHLRLSAAEENLPRIAFITVPAGMVLVALPIGARPSPIWGGIETRAGEMVAFAPGERMHARTGGPCGWGAIQVAAQDLVQYGRALTGAGFAVPPAARWRPPSTASRNFRDLHRAAIRMVEARSGALANVEAAHGLEQQLIDALIECLSGGLAQNETSAAHRHREIVAGFEDLLQADPFPSMTEICSALGVSERMLRECCKQHLGKGPSRYRHLRRMQQVHRALRNENPDAGRVSEVAERYGIRDLGRFAGDYRALYGELPSATLRELHHARWCCLCPGLCESDTWILQEITVTQSFYKS
jgi:AraC-like DNA-binding protein